MLFVKDTDFTAVSALFLRTSLWRASAIAEKNRRRRRRTCLRCRKQEFKVRCCVRDDRPYRGLE